MTEAEYIEFPNRMDSTALYEMDNIGDYFTWTNKHIEWFQENINCTLNILPPNEKGSSNYNRA